MALVRRHFGIVVSFLPNLSNLAHTAVILGSYWHLWPRLSPWVYFGVSSWLWITLSQSPVCNPHGASCRFFGQTPAPTPLYHSHLLPDLSSDLSAAFSLSLAGTPGLLMRMVFWSSTVWYHSSAVPQATWPRVTSYDPPCPIPSSENTVWSFENHFSFIFMCVLV